MEKKSKLPEGWIERRSKTYPDRVYYFNVNTGNSSWEFPDLILTEQVVHRPPVTPQGKDKNDRNLQTIDLTINNKKRQFTEDYIKSPSGKGWQILPHEVRTNISNEPASKKRKISPIKFPAGQSANSGVINVPNVVVYGKKREDVTRNVKHALNFNDKSKESTGHTHLNKNKNARRDEPDEDSGTNSVKSPKTRWKNESVEISKDKYPFVSFLPLSTIQVKSTITEQLLKQQVRSPASHALANSGPSKVAEAAAKSKRTVITIEDLESVRSKQKKGTVASSARKVLDTDKKQCNENNYEYNTNRKIVKSLQRAASRRERTVKAMNGKQLTVETLPYDKALQTEFETSREKPLFKLGNESPGTDSLVDSDNEGKLKQYIGNKEKLLSIQSWIDNLQQGSDSPRIEFYNAQPVSQESAVNQSTDSGFLSPSIKTERGWPGTLKSSLVSSRNLVEMDVETAWELPEVDTTRIEEEMDVDIDEMIYEVRQIVKAQTERKKKSSKQNWEPAFYENQVFQSVVIVVDTNIFLSNLNLVEKLKDYDIPDRGKPTLFIPWVVLQELDVIKESSAGKHKPVQNKARKAIWLLKSFFSKKLANVKGQTPRQDDEASREFQSKCNDDSILQASLQCQKLYVHCEVLLLTNDNNLIVKSMVTGVTACSSTEIHERLEKMKPKVEQKSTVNKISSVVPRPCTYYQTPQTINSRGYGNTVRPDLTSVSSKLKTNCDNITVTTPFRQPPVSQQSPPSLSYGTQRPLLNSNKTYQSDNNCDNKRTASHAGNYNEIPSPHRTQVKCMADTLLQEEQSYTFESLREDIHTKLIAVLQEGFGKVLEEEMKLSYDDFWLQIVHKKPPWTFIDILECWKKHWMVFGLVLKRSLKANVERLVCNFHSKRPHSIRFMFEICQDSLEILRDCVKLNRYGDTMFGIKECVLCIYELCEGLTDNSITVQSISSLNDYLKSKLVPDKTGSACSSHPSPSRQIQTPNRPVHVSGNNGVRSTEQYIPRQTSYDTSHRLNEQSGPKREYIRQSSSHYTSNTQTLNDMNTVPYTSRDLHGPSSGINPHPNDLQIPYSVNTPQQASRNLLHAQRPYHENSVINSPGNLHGNSVINSPVNLHGNSVINSPGNLHGHSVINTPGNLHGSYEINTPESLHGNSVINTPGNLHGNYEIDTPESLHGNSVINTPGNIHGHSVINSPGNLHGHSVINTPGNLHGHSVINTPGNLHGHSVMNTPGNLHGPSVINTPGNLHGHSVINTPGNLHGHSVMNTPGNLHGNSVINTPGNLHGHSVINTPVNLHGHSVINTPVNLHGPNVINATRPVSHDVPGSNCVNTVQLTAQNIPGPYLINTLQHSGQAILPTHQPYDANAVFNSPENIHLHGPNGVNLIQHPGNINIPVPGHAPESIQQPTGYTPAHLQIHNDGHAHHALQPPSENQIQGPHSEYNVANTPGTVNSVSVIEKPSDVMAGELLQQIWEFIFASCNRISEEMSRCNTEGVDKMLHQIVPVTKDLRVVYVGLLEVPMPELSVHEDDFTKFTDLCNSFFFRCGEQVPINAPVNPVGFLMLFSNHTHRETLVNFHARLDDMLRHLYHCLQVVFPDD